MKCLLCWSVLICVCAGPLARGDEARNAKDDGKKMQGSWKPVAAELGGKRKQKENKGKTKGTRTFSS
jgi:hypothetical protein